mmetsp:Transcript_43229/g.125901  ORF Transcript_43229/g.125901 Transcript_43229/m.125901 type:complete len:326 (+) Transcript_43229:1482-2459(+)
MRWFKGANMWSARSARSLQSYRSWTCACAFSRSSCKLLMLSSCSRTVPCKLTSFSRNVSSSCWRAACNCVCSCRSCMCCPRNVDNWSNTSSLSRRCLARSPLILLFSTWRLSMFATCLAMSLFLTSISATRFSTCWRKEIISKSFCPSSSSFWPSACRASVSALARASRASCSAFASASNSACFSATFAFNSASFWPSNSSNSDSFCRTAADLSVLASLSALSLSARAPSSCFCHFSRSDCHWDRSASNSCSRRRSSMRSCSSSHLSWSNATLFCACAFEFASSFMFCICVTVLRVFSKRSFRCWCLDRASSKSLVTLASSLDNL